MEWVCIAGAWQLTRADAIGAAGTLPASPIDGQRITWTMTDDTGIVRWVLRYSTATSTWECEGGSEWYRQMQFPSGSPPINVWGAITPDTLATPALQSGLYEVKYGMRAAINTAVTYIRMAPAIGNTDPATTTYEARAESYNAGCRGEWSANGQDKLTCPFGGVIKARFRTNDAGGAAYVQDCWMSVKPVYLAP
jgi:hypothetical protein